MSCMGAHPSRKCSRTRQPRTSVPSLVGLEMALAAQGKSTMYLEIVFYVSYTWNRSKLLTIISLSANVRITKSRLTY